MRKKDRVKEFLFQVGGWSLVTAVIWLGLSLYQVWKKEPAVKIQQEVLSPISVKFDVETLNQLKERQSLPSNFERKKKKKVEIKEASLSGQKQ